MLKLIVLLTLCCLLTVDAQADSKTIFESGVWTGKVHYSDKTGEWTRCSMMAVHVTSKTTLSFAINQDGLGEMFLYNRVWELKKGEKYNVVYQVDRKPRHTGQAIVIDKTGIIISIQKAKTFFLHIKRGYQLRLTTPVKTFTYGLEGTFGAVKKMKNCYYDRIGDKDRSANKSNPFAGGKKDNSSTTNPFAKRTDGGTARKNLVKKSDRDTTVEFARLVLALLPDAKTELTITDETPEFLKYMNPDIAWYYGGAVGVAHALPYYPSEKTALRVLNRADKKSCAENFVSVSETRSFTNTLYGNVVVIRSACNKHSVSGEPYFAVYTFYRQKKGAQALRIAHVSNDPDIAKEADENFFQVLDRLLDKKNKPL
jgi:hypothetical protein